MRPLRIPATWSNLRRLSSSLPWKRPGSSTPQCAVTGRPGHTGQTSPAASSQTVMTRSITGAPCAANSSQPLLRRPIVEMCCLASVSSAKGLGPASGVLPAEKARKRPLPMSFRSASAMMLRTELCVQINSTLNDRSGTTQTFAQQQPDVFAVSVTLDSDGPQQDDAGNSFAPQLPVVSAPTGPTASLPNNGMDPSERKLSQAMPCGSVTQYLSDLA